MIRDESLLAKDAKINLQMLIEASQLSRAQLVLATGITYERISRQVYGGGSPSLEMIEGISKYFSVPSILLFSRKHLDERDVYLDTDGINALKQTQRDFADYLLKITRRSEEIATQVMSGDVVHALEWGAKREKSKGSK